MRYWFKAAPMKLDHHNARQPYAWMLWLEPALVLLLAPVLLFPSPHRSVFFVFLPFLFVLHFLARRRIVESSPANAPLALLLLMVIVSMYVTYDISFSLPKIAGVLLGAAVFFAIINCARSSRLLALLVSAFILSSVGLSVVGMLGTVWILKVPVLGNITAHLPARIKGLPGAEEGFHPNAIAGSLILFVPLQIALFLSVCRNSVKRRLMLLILGSLFINGGVLLLTQSRGGWFGLAIGLLLLFAWTYPWGKWFALAVFLAGSVVVLWVGPGKVGEMVMTSIGSTSSVVTSVEGRLDALEPSHLWHYRFSFHWNGDEHVPESGARPVSPLSRYPERRYCKLPQPVAADGS